MPGPVSDSYDPEFGTSANAQDVKDAIKEVVEVVGRFIGPEHKDVVGVVQGPEGNIYAGYLSERAIRIIRFGLNRAMKDILPVRVR